MAKKDVLLIDDEPDIRELCASYLEEMGTFRNILESSDGSDAVTKISNQDFALIILDIGIPKKDGVVVAEHIAMANPENLEKVVVLSGTLDKEKLQGLMKVGVKHFLIKPFNEESFTAKIKSIMG